MAWARFDDQINNHPKIIEAGPLADLLYRRAIVYCAQYLTDGRIHCNAVTHLVDWSHCGVFFGLESKSKAEEAGFKLPSNIDLADVLVEVGLMSVDGDYYVVHDFLQYNRSRADIEAEREKSAKRVVTHRKRKCNAVTTPLVTEMKRECNASETPAPSPSPLNTNMSLAPSAATDEPKKKKAKKPDREWSPEAIEVYERQVSLHPEFRKRDTKREEELKAVEAMLAEGFTADELKIAVDNFNADKWVNDTVQTHKLCYLMGDEDTVRQYLAKGSKKSSSAQPEDPHQFLSYLQPIKRNAAS